MNKKATIFLPGLNGLRAIAALGVVISHITIGLKQFNLDPYIFGAAQDGTPKGYDLAGFGVSIFFALSGFLITYLLQVEKGIQNINVRKFYLRRILRIWPLYYLYLLLCLISILAFDLSFDFQSLLFYIFYAANIPFILHSTLPFLAHYWSLGVEEQFYLFWPWVNKKLANVIIPITIAIIILISVKLALHFFYPGSVIELAIDVTRFHCMMIGGLGALLYKKNYIPFLNLIDNKITQSISWFIILLVMLNKFHLASVIDNEIISLVTVFLMIGQINIRHRIINLNLEAFDFLGKISYGIYVIHPLVIFFWSKALKDLRVQDGYKHLIVFVSIISTTIVLAYISYEHFEKYFLKIKARYSDIKSSGTKHFMQPVPHKVPEKEAFMKVESFHRT